MIIMKTKDVVQVFKLILLFFQRRLCVCCVAGTDFPEPTPGVLRFYSMSVCPYAHRSKLVLLHKGIE